MTLGELKREIFSLNFEDFSEYSNYAKQVTDAINRSMSIITTEVRPLVSCYEISNMPIQNIMKSHPPKERLIAYDGKNELEFFSNGEATSFYFECDGEGIAIIADRQGETIIPLVGKRRFIEYKGFCKGEATLRFRGEFAYSVKNLAFYNKRFSSEVKDIPPFKQYIRYDMKSLTNGRFLGFEKSIFEGSENSRESLTDFYIENQFTILLPSNRHGQFRISYYKSFERIDAKTPDSFLIELDDDVVPLLPLLCAYFVWLDDERSRSQEYYAQYEMRRDILVNNQKKAAAFVISGGQAAAEGIIKRGRV